MSLVEDILDIRCRSCGKVLSGNKNVEAAYAEIKKLKEMRAIRQMKTAQKIPARKILARKQQHLEIPIKSKYITAMTAHMPL